MAWPPYDYTAKRDVQVNGVVGYRAGDGMYKQVVEDLGLVLGVDVDAARSDLFDRPADTAARTVWVDYALAQDPALTRDEADDLTRADLIRRFPDPNAKPDAKPKPEKALPKP